jgi:MFS family permease
MSYESKDDKVLFWGCWIALVTTSFAFIGRAFTQGDWAAEFGLSQTQAGEIFGAGLWPFAISIILFSLVMDKIGYKTAMIFGFVCHVLSAVLTYTATGYNSLYFATFIMALGNGTVEAYINPVVATKFSNDKGRWLNYLHGGWSGGFVIAGLILIVLMPTAAWRIKLMLPVIPAIIYFVMLIGKKFPVGESAAAGVPFKETLGEVGGLGFFIFTWMMAAEALRSTGLVTTNFLGIGAAIAAVVGVGVGVYTKSFLGRPMFLILLVLMIPLASTELGVDSWITPLMEPAMGAAAAQWLFVYTALIMTIMRFCSGPVLRALNPLGTLAAAAAIACVAIYLLGSVSSIFVLFLCGTLYGLAKAFFWPTTLGVVSEQFPRGGAMTLNGISGTGILGVGVLGAMALGGMVDRTIDRNLEAESPAIHAAVTVERTGLLGAYQAVDQASYDALPADQKLVVDGVRGGATKDALKSASVMPLIMFITYIALILYFKGRGGYRPVDVATGAAKAGH